MSRQRRNFSGSEKMSILREHLIEHIPVSDICDKHGIQPTLFYLWQKKLFEEGAGVFDRPAKQSTRQKSADAAKIEKLEAKLQQKKRGSRRTYGRTYRAKKKSWGDLTGQWVPHDTGDSLVDFVEKWSAKTELTARHLVGHIGITRSKYYDWRKRFGKVNEHNARVPRDHWLEDWRETCHRGFPYTVSAGRVSPVDVHDARSGRGGHQPHERLSGTLCGGSFTAME